ncbi:hypothetical protein A9P82_01405 [Arachidicoccus ginsenosidimutans]|uniref:hypothetical protein n=1 Tax=Arachidicoccus sp. BS20 TaxID=1850526 RepID=UPI0007F101B7|nr:hypothetical protein [Arachidicoccus sp. BS20]ANI88086.1 hypothetical protein A9P82_01405 [Arachidicoccus sp. BS20]
MKTPARIFLDVNILFDVVNSQSEKHQITKLVIAILEKGNYILYASPTSFAINFYLIGKKYRSIMKAKEVILLLYKNIKFSREDYIIMEKVVQSDFEGLEDAM